MLDVLIFVSMVQLLWLYVQLKTMFDDWFRDRYWVDSKGLTRRDRERLKNNSSTK